VPVEVITHWPTAPTLPRGYWTVLPVGQEVGVADEVEPKKAVETPTKETVVIAKAANRETALRRLLGEGMSFIRRTVTKAGYPEAPAARRV
jgi:hypothetical protein